ncbi:S-adenosyl-L-methionine-dependent methyltransferase [Mycena floridula]|nr:S-adenosyl-L-methionine-dependent methyltransferase [Mycena floridula]
MSSQKASNIDENSPDASGWSAKLYNHNAAFVYSPTFTSPVLTLLEAKPGEKIIDFGCGSGEIVRQSPGGLVLGVDFSSSMIDKAKENGLKNAFVADIQAAELTSNLPNDKVEYDAVFTNAALHWCKRDPKTVIRNAKSMLASGGRFVGEMGGAMNVIGIRGALHKVLSERGHDPVALDPWYFPSIKTYEHLLVSEGFEVRSIELVPRITPLAAGLRGWLNVFVRSSVLKDFEDTEAAAIIEQVENICRVDCQDESGDWSMVYIRLRFSAMLK